MLHKITYFIILIQFCTNTIAAETGIDSTDSFYADTLIVPKPTQHDIAEFEELIENRDRQIGISSFEYGKYTKAIYYLEKSWKDEKDSITADYLYGSYLKMNQTDNANSIFPYLSRQNKKDYFFKPKLLQSIFIEGGCLTNKVSIQSQAHDYNMNYNPGGYGMIGLTHNLTSRLSYKHLFNYYEIPGDQKWTNNDNITEELSNKTKETHLTYAGKLQYSSPKNWVWGLAGAFIKDKISYSKLLVNSYNNEDKSTKRYYDDEAYKEYDPYYGGNTYDIYNGYENGVFWIDSTMKDESAGTLDKVKKSYNNYAFELSVKKNINRFTAGALCSYANIGGYDVFQPKIKGIFFPLQNLNIYSETTLADVIYDHSNNIIIEENIGGRITKWLWLEGAFAYGDMSNYCENDYATFYTTTNKTKYRISGNIIIPINMYLTVYAIYRYMPTESNISDETKTTDNIYTIKNKSQNIIGGLKCNF